MYSLNRIEAITKKLQMFSALGVFFKQLLSLLVLIFCVIIKTSPCVVYFIAKNG
jgi:hypothetical protein